MFSSSILRVNQQQPSSAVKLGFLAARKSADNEIKKLPEILQAAKFVEQLQNSDFDEFKCNNGQPPRPIEDLSSELPPSMFGANYSDQVKNLSHIVDGAFATFALHIESRVANLVGKGFYTIGPCGEELVAPVGLVLRPSDPTALHYRHLAPSIVRRLSNASATTTTSDDEILKDILLDRAKGYTVASSDPICGGHHCCLGGNENDFLVTSTLASQSCPALGRAMAIPLAPMLLGQSFESQQQEYRKMVSTLREEGKATNEKLFKKNGGKKVSKRKQEFGDENILGDLHAPAFPKDAVSFVSLGDGSLNNAHFLSAMNLADYAIHRQFKAPVVFCITDNNISISLRGKGFTNRFVENAARFPTFTARGCDAVDTWIASHEAVRAARKTGRPQLLILNDITRRFGHAATDRQTAYMSRDEIQEWQDRNPLLGFCKSLIQADIFTHKQLADRFTAIWEDTKQAFELADKEPKISTRAQVSTVNSAPLVDLSHKFFKPSSTTSENDNNNSNIANEQSHKNFVFQTQPGTRGAKTHVMRKHMNKVFEEILSEQRDTIYIGEDVTHGGYYLVTDGLEKKFPRRVLDFPPDETSLVGVGLGFSQAGLTPIVEIPYAKYLDCGFDMFTEAIIMHWLSKGKEANGMVIRLQGFGRGVFGGNYHTHNMLHIPPGLDVVCCSRGDDYARLMRYSIQQARAGRMIMFVDATELLNLRDVRPNNACCWEFPYAEKNEINTFDDVSVYHSETPDVKALREADPENKQGKVKKVAIITYGNGLIAALEADAALNSKILDQTHVSIDLDIIDCRLLSAVPQGLREMLLVEDKKKAYDAILFADPCKFGTHPLSMHYQTFVNWAANAKTEGARNLPLSKMKSIGAEFTYNPLGNKLTFLNASDIEDGLIPLLK